MSQKTVDRDSIIDEIHRVRQQMAEQFGGDIAAIHEDARKRQEAAGRAVWQGRTPNDSLQQTGRPAAEVEA